MVLRRLCLGRPTEREPWVGVQSNRYLGNLSLGTMTFLLLIKSILIDDEYNDGYEDDDNDT